MKALRPVATALTRISHTLSTAAAERAMSTALRSVGLPRRTIKYVCGALGRAPCIHGPLRRLATTECKKCGFTLTAVLLLAGPAIVRSQATPAEVALELMRSGRYEEAQQELQRNSPPDPYQLRLLLELAQRGGRTEEAERYALELLARYGQGRLKEASEIAQAAYAAWQLGRWEESNNLFLEAAEAEGASLSTYLDWGKLYLEKYNAAEAELILKDALEASGQATFFHRWGEDDVYVALAQALGDQGRQGSSEALDKALQINPSNLDAMVQQVLANIREENWDEASDWLQKGLKINDAYLPLLEARYALEFFRGRQEQFAKTRKRLESINPGDADLYEILGDLSVTQRRLKEAVGFYDQALQFNPRQWSALSSMGINLLRLGEEERGKEALERAYENDPYNIWTVNTLRLLDSFDRFEEFETPHFKVRLRRDEGAALRPYVEPLLEESLSTLEEKYGHQVAGRYIFEMYPDHADFAVRTLGLPGLGALGATIGRIVAMDSPSARRPEGFHWGSTLWHEVAHVVTLSLSDYRVPRWLTEGLSMMEERNARPGWGDSVNIAFVRAHEEKRLLPLADLNSGFMRPQFPGQLEISYFQAGWVCEFLADRFGVEKLRDLLQAFAAGKTDREAFKEVLGRSLEEIDHDFRRELDQRLEPLVGRLKRPPAASNEPAAGAAHETLSLNMVLTGLEANPDNYFLNAAAGRKLFQDEQPREAIPYLEKAIELFPTEGGKGSPYDLLTRIYLELNEKSEAVRILRLWWQQAPRFSGNAVRLAELLAAEGEAAEAARYLEESMYADPLSPDAHRKLGELYLELQEYEPASREFAILLSFNPADAATAHYLLARAWYGSGQIEAARREVLLALEIAPSFEEAQKLLLEIVRQ